jgi:TonB family protein
MPATEIPPKRPPALPRLDRNDLYDPQNWETVYREMHNVPELLVQLQDDLSRSRKREAFWISVIVHLVIVTVLLNSERFAKYFPGHNITIKASDQKQLTYLEMPQDKQHITKKPDTNIISDKDRIATSRTPRVDPKELRKILDAARRGAPGMNAPPAQQAQPQEQAQQQPEPPQPRSPQVDNNQTADLRMPAQSPTPKPSFNTGDMSAGSAVEQAARSAMAHGRQYGGEGGNYGLGEGRQATGAIGPLDVLSDTMGVDFGPYLQRVLQDVKRNWYNLIPESARAPLMKKGKVSIEFAILKNGRIDAMQITGPSGDVALDRAAWGGISQSAPFPPLPSEFRGDYLSLRFHFYYNPDSSDLQ